MVFKYKKQPGDGKVKLQNAIKDLKNVEFSVGWYANNKYPNSDLPVAVVAAIAEDGYLPKNIPPHPIFKPTINKNSAKWKKNLNSLFKMVLNGDISAVNAAKLQGEQLIGDVKETIINIESPPLKESTIKARLSRLAPSTKRAYTRKKNPKKLPETIRKPLVDTAQLLISVQSRVEKK